MAFLRLSLLYNRLVKKLRLIIHNVRSTYNVGSLLRTSDGLGVEKVYMTGYTPYPQVKNDRRLPHLQQSISRRIHKTALGAEDTVVCEHQPDIKILISKLQKSGFQVVALEQTAQAKNIIDFKLNNDTALIVGEEISGLEPEIVAMTDWQLEIPMLGQKESFNVAVAAAIALYHLRYK
ncbi:MAG: tRNA/rRNA methyltransferase (SpoU) [Candidatus Saccharibacteria bacterium GW2011_GWA2_46_10]|nr:MAG: tRNA/rRNA methyltransferase (SpoU) [Candidatus Saccharibacteria bacterium GW2011_GWA2_46_10]